MPGGQLEVGGWQRWLVKQYTQAERLLFISVDAAAAAAAHSQKTPAEVCFFPLLLNPTLTAMSPEDQTVRFVSLVFFEDL